MTSSATTSPASRVAPERPAAGTILAHRPGWLPPDDVLAKHFGDVSRYPYYRLQLTQYLARLLPERGACSMIDVGAGDGTLGGVFRNWRPDTTVVGVETFVRDERWMTGAIPMVRFDGRRLPFADRSFDVALLSNVLHHTGDQLAVLREVCRVTRGTVIIKDHLSRNLFDRWRLAFLDVMGNLRFGASTTGEYLSDAQWAAMFQAVGARKVHRYDALSFRTGLLERAFGNHLEIIFALEL